MALLTDLPAELLTQILTILGHIDLRSLIVSQAASRHFHAIGQDVIRSVQDHRQLSGVTAARIHPLWRGKFRGLFNSADCFNDEERRAMRYLTLDGDRTLPFRRLLWAQSHETRATYLRLDASWRVISVTFGSGPISHLDVVKSYGWSTGGTDEVDYLQVALPPSGLTMGILYDLLLCDMTMFGRETGSWALLVGRRLRSYDQILEWECFIEDDEDMVDSGPDAQTSAILFVRGGDGCGYSAQPTADGSWTPMILGDVPCFFPWQGPENRRPSV